MNIRLLVKLISKVLLLEAGSMVLPLLVALYYKESPAPFLITIGGMLCLCLPGAFLKAKDHFFAREGYVAVGGIWLLVGLFGAVPFYLSGAFPSFMDCVFEAISGFTTTGATILVDIEVVPRGILFWRALMHWLGGMGILVLIIALMPSLGSRTMFLMRAETPGPVSSKLVPKISQSSKILYAIYTGMTALELAALLLCGLPLYDSVVTAFSTAGTGGFAVKNLSVAAYHSTLVEVVITVFMLAFSVNFTVYFLILSRRWRQALQSNELRFFGITVLAAGLIIAWNIFPLYQSVGESLRHAFFQVSAIISTTGFTSANFDAWPELSRIVLVTLMFFGGCAGSTSGGPKCSRVLILLKAVHQEIKEIIHPRSVNVVKLDNKVVDTQVIHSVMTYFGAFLVILLTTTLIISLDNFSFGTTFTAALACLSNIGPGLEMVGPMGTYVRFSALSKAVMSLSMIIGRLEIFPVLLLFSRDAWRRS